MVMRTVLAFACVGLVTGSARAEPCTGMVGLPAGAVTPCGGILVPPDVPDACSANAESLMSCRRRIVGLQVQHGIEVAGLTGRIERIERARQDERAACQALAAVDPGTDWGAVAWGIVAGLVVGALAVGVPVALTR